MLTVDEDHLCLDEVVEEMKKAYCIKSHIIVDKGVHIVNSSIVTIVHIWII